MRKYLSSLIVVSFLIFPIVVSGEESVSPGSEVGDAMFRPIYWTNKLPLHTGLYRNSESLNEWDPLVSDIVGSDMKHSVIQARRKHELLGLDTYNDFFAGQPHSSQIGKGYTSPGINPYKRKQKWGQTKK